jgi:hypothetical protein
VATAGLAPLGPGGVADLGAFLARVVRLDRATPVRLRAVADGAEGVEVWAWLPYDVLVTRRARLVAGVPDATVDAGELLAALEAATGEVPLPASRDAAWRGALPGSRFADLDKLPVDVVRRLVAAGRRAFYEVRERPDAQAAGEALLAQQVLTVSAQDRSAGLTLGMVTALHHMRFLGDDPVAVAAAPTWVRAVATYGTAYTRRGPGLAVQAVR